MITYWLYYNGQPVYSVRALQGTSEAQVRYLAMNWHSRVPLCYPEYAPFEFTNVLSRSEVRL